MKLILPEKGGGGDLNRKIFMGRPYILEISDRNTFDAIPKPNSD